MVNKQLLFSVTMKDLVMQTFSVGGNGGGGKDTSNSGVRLIHPPSGAVGEGRDHRTNTKNRQDAFVKLANSDKFKTWHKIECARLMGNRLPETPEQIMSRVDKVINDELESGEIKVEVRCNCSSEYYEDFGCICPNCDKKR